MYTGNAIYQALNKARCAQAFGLQTPEDTVSRKSAEFFLARPCATKIETRPGHARAMYT